MTRGDFFKAAGLLVASALSVKVNGHKLSNVKVKNPSKAKVCVDIRTINFRDNRPGRSQKDILDLYFQTGVLVYDGTKGDAPIFVDGEVELVNVHQTE